MSDTLIPLMLSDNHLGQILDGIRVRAEAYEGTADRYAGECTDIEFQIEEVNDAEEAQAIANLYREIETELMRQWDEARVAQGIKPIH